MSVKFPWRYATQDLSAGDLTIQGRTDRSYEICEIFITGHAGLLVPQLFINDKIMLGMPSTTTLQQLFPNRFESTNHRSLLKMIYDKFPDAPTFKSAPGDDVRITDPAGSGIATVIYKELDGTDVFKGSEPGAPEGPSNLFISQGRTQANIAVAAGAIVEFDDPENPAGLYGFPFGNVCPSNRTMELIGFATKPGASIGANTTFTGIRMWKNETAFLVNDEAFIRPGLFPYLPENADNTILLLDETIMFQANDQFKIEGQFTNAGAGAELAEAYLAAIFIQRNK